MKYKHTQVGYLMLFVALLVSMIFVWLHVTVSAEPPSVDSGSNFLFTFVMTLIVFVLFSFGSLQVIVNEKFLQIKFGFGIFRKKFLLENILSVKTARNHWHYGWGIRWWFWPRMWIFSVSGFDAVEIKLKNGKIFRIGTDEPEKLEKVILDSIK